MTRLSPRYTPEAARLIKHLPPELKRLVRAAIDSLRIDPYIGHRRDVYETLKLLLMETDSTDSVALQRV